ncbi:MAG: hypothetical protein AAB577_01070 [Patescibacteria group bacterium]
MNGKKINNVLIVCDKLKPNAVAYLDGLKTSLEQAKIGFTEKGYVGLMDFVDMIVVLGGDGFMSETINGCLNFHKPFLGINFGTIRGFLLNDNRPDIANLLAQGRYEIFKLPLLHVDAVSADGILYENDSEGNIYVERSTSQCAKFNIKIDGVDFGKEIMADGLVVSTSLGSSAYFLSAGGAAMHPLLPVMGIRSICEIWPPTLPPLVLSLDAKIEIEILQPQKRKVRATSGELFTYENVVQVVVGKSPDKFFYLALLEGESFLKTISKKILRVQEEKNG